MCLAQGPGDNAVTQVRLKPTAPRSRVKYSSTEPLRSIFTNSEDPDEMPQHAAFHQGLHCLLVKKNTDKNTILFKNHNLIPLDIYNGPSLGTSKFIVSNQREESICPKGSITLQYSTTTKLYCDISFLVFWESKVRPFHVLTIQISYQRQYFSVFFLWVKKTMTYLQVLDCTTVFNLMSPLITEQPID